MTEGKRETSISDFGSLARDDVSIGAPAAGRLDVTRPRLTMSQPTAADASPSLEGAALHQELAQLRSENAALRARLSQADAHTHRHEAADTASPQALPEALRWSDPAGHGLSTAQLRRYARHVALRGFGPAAQGALCASRVLVVGAGGLGCPAALYLAAAGVGTLAIADGDVVEESNLHRQVLYTQARSFVLWPSPQETLDAPHSCLLASSEHTLALLQQASVGTSKAVCAAAAIAARNPGVAVRALPAVTAETAVHLLRDYDLVLDCTDTPSSRYMLSDAAVCVGIPLVSGASIGMEGQVSVLCRTSASAPPATAPCYRCLYPVPPPPGHCATCAEAGVLGPVPGVIGVLQAVEAIKVLCGIGAPLAGALMCYDALSGDAPFYTVQLPPQRQDCAACGTGPNSLCARAAAGDGAIVAGLAGDLALPPQTARLASTVAVPPAPPTTWPRLTVATYAAMRRDDGLSGHILIDVRPAHVFQAACLQGAINVPFKAGDSPADLLATVTGLRAHDAADSQKLVVLLCRAGNSSAAAADALVRANVDKVVDVAGGLTEWRAHIDPTFPL